MTTADLKALTHALEARARELRRSLANRNQIAVEAAADPFDEQVLASDRECSAQTLTQESRLLREVEAARDRLRAGAFGVCVRCEEGIALKRLLAIPWAAYCVACRVKAEDGTPGSAWKKAV